MLVFYNDLNERNADGSTPGEVLCLARSAARAYLIRSLAEPRLLGSARLRVRARAHAPVFTGSLHFTI